LSSSGNKAQRTCLGCRAVCNQDQVVRYVLSPQGEVLVDYRRKLPGRGAYTCLDRSCIETAVRRNQFDRAFKGRAGSRPDEGELTAALADQILERIVALLGMSRKSAKAVSGSNLVLSALGGHGRISFVLLAEDVSAGIADKVIGKADRMKIPCFRLLTKDFMGQVMGKGERSVIALASGPLAKAIMVELVRYKQIVGES
jgi:predicted RNA-binding protein YlxR (DUF448 family)